MATKKEKKSNESPKRSPSRKKTGLRARREKADGVLALLQKRYPMPETHLTHHNAWELLVATVLAAQCTDERVNTVTPGLFARWPGPAEMAEADITDLENQVRPTGFYRNKAAHLLASAKRVRDVYGGQVPDRMEELITLPGVARKTANVVLFGAFGRNEGLAVDTHVGRIAWRLGLASGRDPIRTEKELMEIFPKEEWGNVNHRLVWFGRHVCKARGPLCGECEMESLCDKQGLALS